MKCTIKAKCNKETFLKYTSYSNECKYKNGYTYGFYDYKSNAEIDSYKLRSIRPKAVHTEILRGWDIDGFKTFRK